MHPFEIPADVQARVTARRGRPFAFERIVPPRTALVVIDLQNAFLSPGSAGEVPMARAIVPTVNRLAAAARRRGGCVVWVQMQADAGRADGGWPVFFGELFSPQVSRAYICGLHPGSEGHRLWPELEVHATDLRAAKDRFSAFLPGACDLGPRLRDRGVDTLLIAGTLTSVCCESSARDAAMLGFRVIMVSDANASRTDEDHRASLIALYQSFADVRSSAEVLDLLRE